MKGILNIRTISCCSAEIVYNILVLIPYILVQFPDGNRFMCLYRLKRFWFPVFIKSSHKNESHIYTVKQMSPKQPTHHHTKKPIAKITSIMVLVISIELLIYDNRMIYKDLTMMITLLSYPRDIFHPLTFSTCIQLSGFDNDCTTAENPSYLHVQKHLYC